MSRNVLRLLLFMALGGVIGCPADDDDDSTPPPEPCQREEDRTLPALLAQGPDEAQTSGFPVEVLAQASDPDGLNAVTLWYRIAGSTPFLSNFMTLVDEENGIYRGEVPGNYVVEPGVEWYVTATDRGPCADTASYPPDAPATLLSFLTEVVVLPLPLYQDFEVPECLISEDIGGAFTVFAQSFPDVTHNWRNDARSPYRGSCSASHSEGVPGLWDCPPPEADGNIERLNWLITPALDFTGKSSVAVRWFERRQNLGPCAEVHRLYVSVGSPNPGSDPPEVADWQLVADDLPKPGTDWQSSGWHDLSQFVGSDTVYVALVYQGGAAGRWQIDDLYVGEPLADLAIDVIPTLTPDVAPGTVGVTLDLAIRNVGTEYDAPALTARLETDDPNLAIATAAASYPAIPVGSVADSDVPFVFDVLATHADNAYLDFRLVLDDGASHIWELPLRLLMGEESTVTVSVTPGDAPLTLLLGHGPVALPNFIVQTSSAPLPAGVWTSNVTEQADRLPPGPGPARWFLQVTNPGTTAATVDAWSFVVGGVTMGPEGALPATVGPGQEILLRFPSPPILVVQSVSTTPDPAAPGDSISIDALVLRNDGASTVGGLNCVLDSAHPNASGFTGELLTFGGATVPNGGTVTLDQAPSFDLSAAHTDDEPISLVLLCSDGFDSLPVPFGIDVPYARPRVAGTLIQDRPSACSGCSGDNDGYADADEVVGVLLSVINDGSLPTNAAVTATVTASPNSPIAFTLTNGNNIALGSGTLDPGESATASVPFQLGVPPTALLGDRMVLDVVFSAGADSWTDELTIDVTAIPWLPCNSTDDALGDVIGGVGLDLRSCEHRSDGTMLQLRVNSWNAFDPTTQALWFFFYEAPSLYSIEFVPPAPPTLETGCISGADVVTVQPLSVDNQLTTSASVRVGLDDLNELGNNLAVGFAAGYCLGFCDVYPQDAALWQPASSVLQCSQQQFIQINW